MSKKATSALIGVLGLLALVPPPVAARLPARTSGCSISRSRCRPTSRRRRKTGIGTIERYERMPILGPITPGSPETALDPPSDDEVMRALEKANPVQGGLPFLYEIQRNNVRIVVEPIADYVDPPRVYPAGRARPTPSRPLQVHRVLHRGHAGWLADPVHQHGRGRPRGDLHRPRPSPHGRERGSRPGQQLLILPSAAVGDDRKERLSQTPVARPLGFVALSLVRRARATWVPHAEREEYTIFEPC